ncbi:uncharacterized protein EI97DRAFT_498683 [Westerdykella ornata]|uniref:Uncharacterized protein n=1 Tax=Westerdykella ornata TaxID=318751 RepID=A0A6A6JWG8_WESOR|nr:uncharacterized protein EI97DRAFT_498683 [Westerdykella ornata]KAF2280544.1 hypothetical protein EI97DRAFT_498683 [Westerdykella ornata]
MSGRGSNLEHHAGASKIVSTQSQQEKGKNVLATQDRGKENKQQLSHASASDNHDARCPQVGKQIPNAETEADGLEKLLLEAVIITHANQREKVIRSGGHSTLKQYSTRVSFHERDGEHLVVVAQHGRLQKGDIVILEAVGRGTSRYLAVKDALPSIDPVLSDTRKKEGKKMRGKSYYETWNDMLAEGVFACLGAEQQISKEFCTELEKKVQEELKRGKPVLSGWLSGLFS